MANGPAAPTVAFGQFAAVDIRVGTVVAVAPFPEAQRPALKLTIDFGPEIGRKRSSAQITHHYADAELMGRKVAAVVNFAPRQIGPSCPRFWSSARAMSTETSCLMVPHRDVPDGSRIY